MRRMLELAMIFYDSYCAIEFELALLFILGTEQGQGQGQHQCQTLKLDPEVGSVKG